MRKFVIALLSVVCLLDLTGCHHSTTKDKGKETVTITGRVTDFEGHPIDSCSIWWKAPSFENVMEVFTKFCNYLWDDLQSRLLVQ